MAEGKNTISVPIRGDTIVGPETVVEAYLNDESVTTDRSGYVHTETVGIVSDPSDTMFGRIYYVLGVRECTPATDSICLTRAEAEDEANRIGEGEYKFASDMSIGEYPIPRALIYEAELVLESEQEERKRIERSKRRANERERRREWHESQRQQIKEEIRGAQTDLRQAYAPSDQPYNVPKPDLDRMVTQTYSATTKQIAVVLGVLTVGHVGLAYWQYHINDLLMAVFNVIMVVVLSGLTLLYYRRSRNVSKTAEDGHGSEYDE